VRPRLRLDIDEVPAGDQLFGLGKRAIGHHRSGVGAAVAD
jgi:hypothetical protein